MILTRPLPHSAPSQRRPAGGWGLVLAVVLVLGVGGVLGVVLVVAGPATPAAAHDVGGVGATNFATTLSGLSPAVPGVSLRVIENGSRLELRNDTGREVTVAGYAGEPYARVGPDGVFLNQRSPATYLNTDRFSAVTVPAGASTTAAPVWLRVDSQPVFRWHDHRTHWMLAILPPAVAAAPDRPHHISSWSIGLTWGAQGLTAAGSLDWVPGPSPWPWILLIALLTVGLAGAARLRSPYGLLAVATGVVVVGQAVHGLGISAAIVGSVWQRLGAVVGSDAVLVWPFALLAGWLLARRQARASWLSAAAGLIVAITLIVDDAPLWWRSSAPSGLPPTLNRAVLAVTVGAGLGLVAALPVVLRRHAPPARPWAAPAPMDEQFGKEGGMTQPAPLRSPEEDESDPPAAAAIGRRRMAGYLAAGAVGALTGATVGATLGGQAAAPPSRPSGPPLSDVGARLVPFHGPVQAGIARPFRQQAHGWLAGFDLSPTAGRDDVRGLLQSWTRAARALTTGQPIGTTDDAVVAGLGAAALTVTVGFGPSLFGRAGIPLSARPPALAPLPAFPGERLDPRRGDGDLGVQIAADDPVVVAHAARVLTRLANGTASVRWQQSGFNASRGTGADSVTPRNLMGQLDGTNNPRPDDPDFAARILVPPDDPATWLRGGSYVVIRRIRMLLDDWDRVGRPDQEQIIGRRRDTGAPLSGGSERTPPDFGARGADGQPAIAINAHLRLANPAFNQGAAMLRRGFSFTDGPDSGLLFVAWQADPRRGFIPVQRRLVEADALGPFIRHETSALFAVPGGVGPADYLGQGLLEP